MVDCVFIEVETEDTLFDFVYLQKLKQKINIILVCTLLSDIETIGTIFESTSLAAKRRQHLLISMDPTKGSKSLAFNNAQI